VEDKFSHSMFSDPIEACLLNPMSDDIELEKAHVILDVDPVMDNKM